MQVSPNNAVCVVFADNSCAQRTLRLLKKALAEEYYQQGLRVYQTDLTKAMQHWQRSLQYDPQPRTGRGAPGTVQTDTKKVKDHSVR